MEIGELRVGNYVIELGEVTYIGNGNDIDYHFNFKSIPLTEEWLLKFGFEWSIFHQAFHKEGFKYDFIQLYKGGFRLQEFKGIGDFKIEVFDVHQLQNLYFALTGKELECNG